MTRWPSLPADVAPVPGQMKGTMMTKEEIEALVKRLSALEYHMGESRTHDDVDKKTVGEAVKAITALRAENEDEFMRGMAHGQSIVKGKTFHIVDSPELKTLHDQLSAASNALTVLQSQLAAAEARAEKAEGQAALFEVELERLREAIKMKGGTEHSPTEDAYNAACAAIRKHKDRAAAAEALLGAAYRAGLEDAAEGIVTPPDPADLAARLGGAE